MSDRKQEAEHCIVGRAVSLGAFSLGGQNRLVQWRLELGDGWSGSNSWKFAAVPGTHLWQSAETGRQQSEVKRCYLRLRVGPISRTLLQLREPPPLLWLLLLLSSGCPLTLLPLHVLPRLLLLLALLCSIGRLKRNPTDGPLSIGVVLLLLALLLLAISLRPLGLVVTPTILCCLPIGHLPGLLSLLLLGCLSIPSLLLPILLCLLLLCLLTIPLTVLLWLLAVLPIVLQAVLLAVMLLLGLLALLCLPLLLSVLLLPVLLLWLLLLLVVLLLLLPSGSTSSTSTSASTSSGPFSRTSYLSHHR
jgi:hypothetical protein